MRAALVLGLLAAGCREPSQRSLDVCARGDRALLGAALAGGRIDVRVEVEGEVVAEGSVPADGPSRIDIDLPAGHAEVVLEGRDSGGEVVASGEGVLDGDGGCACLALAAQEAAVCGGIECAVVADRCRFDQNGLPAGRQTLTALAVADTWLDGTQPDAPHGDDPMLRVAVDATALVRFDLSALPAAATIEGATLTLARADGSTSRPVLDVIAAAWDPGTATWNDAPALEALGLPAQPGPTDTILYDVTDVVARWVGAAGENPALGVELSLASGSAAFHSADASSGQPVLRVDYNVEAMGVVPAGAFESGCPGICDPDEETGAADGCGCDEQPVHEVALSEFEIDRTEVTQAAYAACVMAGACSEPGAGADCMWDPSHRPNYPVACVTWTQARTYCEFAGKRLPTEAEWESAAAGSRAGRYPWGDAMPTCALARSYYCTPGDAAAAEADAVGRHPDGVSVEGAAELALDMAGNLFEWVGDRYDAAYYGSLAGAGEPAVDPAGPEAGDERVRRGGFYFSGEWLLRAGNRDHLAPSMRNDATGFRCAR
jgi:formylglycine-generating enzyme required for sulfatase activity